MHMGIIPPICKDKEVFDGFSPSPSTFQINYTSISHVSGFVWHAACMMASKWDVMRAQKQVGQLSLRHHSMSLTPHLLLLQLGVEWGLSAWPLSSSQHISPLGDSVSYLSTSRPGRRRRAMWECGNTGTDVDCQGTNILLSIPGPEQEENWRWGCGKALFPLTRLLASLFITG